MPRQAIFISWMPLWEVRWWPSTPPGPLVNLDRWRIVAGGVRRVPTSGFIGLDRVTFATFGPARPTSLAEGSYYTPPPYEIANGWGWPLQRFDAFPTMVI